MAKEVLLFFVGFGAQCGSECSRQRIEEDDCIFRTLRSNVRDLASEERIVRMDGLIHSTRIHVILKCLWRREHARCRDPKQRQTSKRIRRLQSNWIRRHAEIRDIQSSSCESYIKLIE